MNSLQRCAFLSERSSPELIEHFRIGGPYTHFVTVKTDSAATEGLSDSERVRGYSSRDLADSVSRINDRLSPSRLVDETSVMDLCGRRRTYAHDHQAGGVIVTFEEMAGEDYIGNGVLIAHEHTGILTEMLRAYGLPFPANMRRTRQ